MRAACLPSGIKSAKASICNIYFCLAAVCNGDILASETPHLPFFSARVEDE